MTVLAVEAVSRAVRRSWRNMRTPVSVLVPALNGLHADGALKPQTRSKQPVGSADTRQADSMPSDLGVYPPLLRVTVPVWGCK